MCAYEYRKNLGIELAKETDISSLVNVAPTISKAQVSDAKIKEFFNLPVPWSYSNRISNTHKFYLSSKLVSIHLVSEKVHL